MEESDFDIGFDRIGGCADLLLSVPPDRPLRTVSVRCVSEPDIAWRHLELWLCRPREKHVFWTDLWFEGMDTSQPLTFACAPIHPSFCAARLVLRRVESGWLDPGASTASQSEALPNPVLLKVAFSSLPFDPAPLRPSAAGTAAVQGLLDQVGALRAELTQLQTQIATQEQHAVVEALRKIVEEQKATGHSSAQVEQRVFEHVRAALPVFVSSMMQGKSSTVQQHTAQPMVVCETPPSGASAHLTHTSHSANSWQCIIDVENRPDIIELKRRLANKLQQREAMLNCK